MTAPQERPEQKFRRPPLYYHAPDIEELIEEGYITQERVHHLTGLIWQQLFFRPSLSFSRECWGGMLWEMYHRSQEARDSDYDDFEILLSIALLQEWLTSFGLVQGKEIEALHQGEKIPQIDPRPKYATRKEIKALARKWQEENKVVAMPHGAIDPPQIGHARLIATVWPHADIVVVGFDTDTILKQRKRKEGEKRPRFPLAWRMWEIASLPTVDKVIVLPVREPSSTEYMRVYRELNVRVLGTSNDNPLLPEYQRRMEEMGGKVVITDRIFSSTRLVNELSQPEIFKKTLIPLPAMHTWARQMAEAAQVAGYLRDYPNGT